MTFETAKDLLGRPDEWPNLSEDDLMQLASLGSWVAALTDDEGVEESFGALYAYAVESLPAHTRRQIAADLGTVLEEFGREHGTCPVNVLRLWLLGDPDPGVVSTAALAAAQVMPPADEDPLTGPKLLLALAVEATDAGTQGAIVSGLAALGEAEVLALVDEAWDTLAGDAQSDVLQRMGRGAPTMAAIDFLVSRLERAADHGEEGPVGHVVASLVRLRQAAGQPTVGGASGVPDIDRVFPSWSLEEGESPIIVREVHDPRAVGERLGRRLHRAAVAETYPRLLPLALRAWGIEDAAFVDAVRQAVTALSVGTGACGLLDVPLPVEPMPDWARDDAVMTWGILNPFGPTKVQICRVPADDETDALVYTLHNPIAPVCLLLGTVPSGDAASTARLLLELATRFHLGEAHVLLKGLPHWVVVSADSGLNAAAFFRSAHAAALHQDLACDDDLDELIPSLHRFRLDAQQEVHRQFQEAMATYATAGHAPARGTPRVAAPLGAYKRWLKAASDARHVAVVSAQFMDCWNAALRFQRGPAGDEN
jgi:hypothetical protein